MEATTGTQSAAQLDQLCINTIRTLSMDAVQAANSGHPESAGFQALPTASSAQQVGSMRLPLPG